MVFVPGYNGYRLIFDTSDTSIEFPQLLVNVAFAALLGAILATIVAKMSKRALKYTLWVLGPSTAIGIWMAIFTIDATEQEQTGTDYDRSYRHGRWPDFRDKFNPGYARAALACYRRSAKSWRWALRFDKANEIEERAKAFQAEIGEQEKQAISP